MPPHRIQPTDCIEADFETPWYRRWADRLAFPSSRHAKWWETAIIAEALEERGCLRPGAVGLGLGVGREALASLFASMGVSVVATDQDATHPDAQQWSEHQLAREAADLYVPHLLDRAEFDRLVHFEPYDMRTYEPSYADRFDFVWHNCSIGHLGSMAESAKQLLRSSRYLRPGGWLVFTTELNISDVHETIHDGSDTILWRLEDLRLLFPEMAGEGLHGEALLLRLGTSDVDRRITREPTWALRDQPDETTIKVTFAGFALTQVLLCFQKEGTDSRPPDVDESIWTANYLTLEAHTTINADLREYHVPWSEELCRAADIAPEQAVVSASAAPGDEVEVELPFVNRADVAVFDDDGSRPRGTPPLVMATFGPVNRSSELAHDSWFSSNRPAVLFTAEPGRRHHHRARPGERFSFGLRLQAPNAPGVYVERFGLVFEGVADLASTEVEVRLAVTGE
jgi:SAM-dependent methyltransferase